MAVRDAGLDVVTTNDLRNRLLYDLDRETAAHIFEEHFGRPLDLAETMTDEDASDSPKGRVAVTLASNAEQVAGVVLVVLLPAVWVAGAGLLPDSR